MKVLDLVEAARTIARKLKKPVLFLHINDPEFDPDGRLLPAPYLTASLHGQAISDGTAFVVCDSEEEMEDLYWKTVGDDGPTAANPYNGKSNVYALTIDRKGGTRNENT